MAGHGKLKALGTIPGTLSILFFLGAVSENSVSQKIGVLSSTSLRSAASWTHPKERGFRIPNGS